MRTRVNSAELFFQCDAYEDSDRARHLYSRGTSSHEHKGKKIFVQSWVFFRLRDLKGAQDTVSECHRVGETFEAGGILSNSGWPK